MPIYEYRCEACDHELEALQKLSDAALTECPECKQESLKKLISAAGFRLKGSGWYETDYKSGNKKNVHDSGKSESKSESCSSGSCGCS
jgi:putative FmdB family regulatory protein